MYEIVCDKSPFRDDLIRKKSRYFIFAWVIAWWWVIGNRYGIAVIHKLQEDDNPRDGKGEKGGEE